MTPPSAAAGSCYIRKSGRLLDIRRWTFRQYVPICSSDEVPSFYTCPVVC